MSDQTKIIIANRDPDVANEAKEVAPISWDAADLAAEVSCSPPAADLLPAVVAAVVKNPQFPVAQVDKEAELNVFNAKIEELRADLKVRTGLSIGGVDPYLFKPKSKQAYGLWRRCVQAFAISDEVLSMPPRRLIPFLQKEEYNLTITRDMLYDRLSDFAVKDLKRMLADIGINVPLPKAVTIRSIQLLMLEQKGRGLSSASRFTANCEIVGDYFKINGRSLKILPASAGGQRVNFEGGYLRIDVLRDLCRD